MFKYILKNRSEISSSNGLQEIGLNLKAFNSKEIISICAEVIQKSYNCNELIKTICFLKNYCKNTPKITLAHSKKMVILFNEARCKLANFKDIDFLDKFSLFGFESNKNYILSNILNSQNLEECDIYFKELFDLLMNDPSIAIDYFIILFEKKSGKQNVKINELLEIYMKQYNKYPNSFMKAIDRIFYYNSDDLIRKVHFESNSEKYSHIAISIVSEFFNEAKKNPGRFQPFYCLLNIASTFPFLFNKNPKRVFTTILPALDNFSLLFTISYKSDAKVINSLKASLCALYFLFNALYSVKILDEFVIWLYKNIENFSQSQIIAFSYILGSLFNSQKVNLVMLALSSKFNFQSILVKLLQKEVDENLIILYKRNIYEILNSYYKLISQLNINHPDDFILVNEIKKANNPFMHVFNNYSSIFPQILFNFYFPLINNNEITEFETKIKRIKSFSIHFSYDICYPTEHENKKFLHQQKLKVDRINLSQSRLPDYYYISRLNLIQLCVKKPFWVYEYFIKGNDFPVTIYHFNILKQVIKKYNKNIKIDINFFEDEYKQYDLLNLIYKEVITDNNKEIAINSLFDMLISNQEVSQMYLFKIKMDIKSIINQGNMDIILKVLKNMQKQKTSDIYLTSAIIDMALSPKYRNNITFLTRVVEALIHFEKLPPTACHLIFFILIQNKSYDIITAFELCMKIKKENLLILERFFEKIVDDLDEKANNLIVIIKYIMELFPSIIPKKMSKFINVLNEMISNHNDIKTIDFIVHLFNLLTPKRNKNMKITFENESRNEKNCNKYTLLIPPPSNLVETNPIFWNFFTSQIQFFSNILYENWKYYNELSVLDYFPELIMLSYEKLFNFQSEMKSKISYSQYNLEIRRSSIFLDSYNLLKKTSLEKWLSKLHVTFMGEIGLDYGGLTREWFSLMVKEIFNPIFALFHLARNQKYQPSHLSYVNENHIELFRFAGKFIARSIIQNQSLKIHFTNCFYKQILQKEITYEDFKDVDEDIYRSMVFIMNEDVEQLDLNFTIDVDLYGKIQTVLLKDNGDEIKVTNENKEEYLYLYTNYHLKELIIKQITAFCEGFYWMIPFDEIKILNIKELDCLICGSSFIDVNDLRESIAYIYPYSMNHPVIQIFFNVISKWNQENLEKLLVFITGSPQVPLFGFSYYKEKGEAIKIAPGGDRKRLCVAHTCFNQLDLPQYENENELNYKLLQSINEYHFDLI